MSIYQDIESRDVIVTPYKAYKLYTIDETSATASYYIYTYKGSYSGTKYNIGDSNDDLVTSLVTSSDSKYRFSVHDSLYNSYYENFVDKPYGLFEQPHNRQRRNLGIFATVLAIPQVYYGEQIKPNSITLTENSKSLNIIDDGYGNLIDTSISSSVASIFTSLEDSLVGNWTCNEIYRTGSIHLVDNARRNHGALYNTSVKPSSYLSANVVTLTFATGSYVRAPHDDIYNFRNNEDFAISIYTEVISGSDTYSSIVSKDGAILESSTLGTSSIDITGSFVYPYKLDIINSSGKIRGTIYDGQITTEVISSTVVTSSGYMVWLQRKTNTLELYINGVLEDSAIDNTNGDTQNECDLFFGQKGNGTQYTQGNIRDICIYSESFSAANILNFSQYNLSESYNYYVGNVFYDTGMICITSTYASYSMFADYTGSDGWDLLYRSTKTIHEYNIDCSTPASELNHTFNPSCKASRKINDDNYASFITHNEFTPYVTQVGLYNDNLELLAIAKISKPIKKIRNTDLTINVRFDI